MKITFPAVTTAIAVLVSLATLSDAQAFFRGNDIQSTRELPAGFIRFAAETSDGNGIFHCSATKIRPHVFLTAAHCLENLEAGDSIRILSHEDLALEYSEDVEGLVSAHNAKISALQQQYESGAIGYETALAQSKALEAELDQLAGNALSQWKASSENPVTHIFANPEYDQESVRDQMKADVGIFVTKYDPKYVTTASIDLDYVVSSSSEYLTVGHDRTTEDYTKNYKYEVTDKLKTGLSRDYSVYAFGTPLGKGRVTQGDSGGGLYRLNPRTGRFDTVIGVTSAITKALFIHSGSYYAPIHRSIFAGNGGWIEETLRKIDALELNSSASFF